MIVKSDGFSLIELLVTVGILGILSGVAIANYTKYKEAPIKAAMKTELSDLSKFLDYAHSVDGGYHHNIFTMGYRPSKTLVADTGFEYARGTKPDCTSLPQKNTGNFSSYLTITKDSFDNTHVDSSTQASHICSSGHCTTTNTVVPGTLSTQTFTSGHAGCKTAFSGKAFKCSCDAFIIYSRAYIRPNVEGKMLTNQDGAFGFSDQANHIDLY